MSGRLGPSGLRARRQRNLTKRNKAGRWRGRGTLVEMQKKELAERIEDMARKTREQRHAAYQRKVEGHKQRLREEMQEGGHIYGKEWLREAIRSGDYAYAEAIEGMIGEITAHNIDNPPDFPRQKVDDHLDDMRDLERHRQRARDNERAAGIAEGARKKAAGIGGGVFATAAPEPEPEDDEPDPAQEEHEDRRQTLMRHGLLSRTPAPPQEPRKKKRRGYSYPPFAG